VDCRPRYSDGSSEQHYITKCRKSSA
jgi:hypothetical protein